MKLSYAITVKNELTEVQRLLDFLFESTRPEDEIVILFDDKGSREVWDCISGYEDTKHGGSSKVQLYSDTFEGHFGDWKNKLTSLCRGDYIFQIDADEYPHLSLLKSLPDVLAANPTIDVLMVPRVNTVEGLTDAHIEKWGWKVNEKGWVNWPDYQWRVYRNTPEIKWINKVHEVLTGFTYIGHLPHEEYWALYHPKTIEKQEKQNNYYSTL